MLNPKVISVSEGISLIANTLAEAARQEQVEITPGLTYRDNAMTEWERGMTKAVSEISDMVFNAHHFECRSARGRYPLEISVRIHSFVGDADVKIKFVDFWVSPDEANLMVQFYAQVVVIAKALEAALRDVRVQA